MITSKNKIYKKYFIVKIAYTLFLLIVVPSTLGCTNNAQSGGLVGAVIGGGLGYWVCKDKNSGDRSACIVAGALTGLVAGSVIGSYMDKTDKDKLLVHFQNAPRGVNRNWENPKTGNRFTFRAISDLVTVGDKKCRSYQLWGLKKGNSETDYEKFTKQCIK